MSSAVKVSQERHFFCGWWTVFPQNNFFFFTDTWNRDISIIIFDDVRTQPMFVLCCVCVSVRPAGVTVLVCVPQKLPSIYKLYFFFECVLLCCSKLRWDSHSVLLTTEDRPSWAADNIPLKVISPQNKARAPLFFLQITVLVTVPVYRVSVVFFSFFSFPFFLPHSCERFEFCFWPCPHPFPQAMAY